jgi:hypothetical protein
VLLRLLDVLHDLEAQLLREERDRLVILPDDQSHLGDGLRH